VFDFWIGLLLTREGGGQHSQATQPPTEKNFFD